MSHNVKVNRFDTRLSSHCHVEPFAISEDRQEKAVGDGLVAWSRQPTDASEVAESERELIRVRAGAGGTRAGQNGVKLGRK